MLWYKAWLETRARFLISLIGMVGLSTSFVAKEAEGMRTVAPLSWYYRSLHFGHSLLAIMWLAAVMLLMMGGLVREKAAGTSSFTLALPVSRERFMRVRVLFGLLQAIALIVIPWGAMYIVSRATGEPTALSQALFHMLVLAAGGLVFFAVALLTSVSVEGEYTAPAVSFGVVFLSVITFGSKPWNAYNPWNLMVASEFFDSNSSLLLGPVPWVQIVLTLVFAAAVVASAVVVVQRREF